MSIHEEDSVNNQLARWWENAEEGTPAPGDLAIERHVDERTGKLIRYAIGEYKEGTRPLIGKSGTRIVERVPEPRPAWHNSRAVIASAELFPGERRVMVKCGETTVGNGTTVIYWEDSSSGAEWRSEDLRDVTPLIEAKVTDDMVEKARDYMSVQTGQTHTHNAIRGTLRAALGIEDSNV